MIAPPACWPAALRRCGAVALAALLFGNAQARGIAVNGVVLDERSVAALVRPGIWLFQRALDQHSSIQSEID